ncbi:unnamed protein product [Trichobilharzia regenti]|nr:unnamed protein product [Trichobilharzia regenti]
MILLHMIGVLVLKKLMTQIYTFHLKKAMLSFVRLLTHGVFVLTNLVKHGLNACLSLVQCYKNLYGVIFI